MTTRTRTSSPRGGGRPGRRRTTNDLPERTRRGQDPPVRVRGDAFRRVPAGRRGGPGRPAGDAGGGRRPLRRGRQRPAGGPPAEIGRASCRERGESPGVAV